MVGFPYTYGDSDIKNLDYEIKLVKTLVYFLKGTVHQTYRITQIISEYGLVKKVRIILVTFVFVLGLSFASLEPVELIIQKENQIERHLSSLVQAIESSENPSATSISRGGDLGKGSSPGARAKSDARAVINKKVNDGKSIKSEPGRKGVAEALTLSSFNRRRPAALNCLLRKLQPRPTLDPYNPGCAGGPRSITVLSSQSNPNSPTNQPVREITAHDGVKSRLTDKSLNHLTSKHADALGIDDPLPPNPNQKSAAYKHKQTRTRVNEVNKRKFGDTVKTILEDPNTEIFTDISMRGITGHGYYNEDYGESGFFVGIHNEGNFTGEIKKAQPISEAQLKVLQEKNKID